MLSKKRLTLYNEPTMRFNGRSLEKRQITLRLLIVGVVAGIGTYFLYGSHAATPQTASNEAENGTLHNQAVIGSDAAASGGSYVAFGTPAVANLTPLLGALGPTDTNANLAAAGFRSVVIATSWNAFEPAQGSFSSSATSDIQNQINAAKAAGLSPSLDIGIQYPPSWIFNVGGGTRFVDQYGDVADSSAGAGNAVANAVTNTAVRTEVGKYLTYLGSHLTGLDSVRLGGLGYNELRYPAGTAGSQPNAFWFYDSSSQASLPASVQGWKPGTGTVAQATTFLNAYNSAIVGYGVWLIQTGETAFPNTTKLELLLPDWGQRPGEAATAEGKLLASSPNQISEGLDWTDLLSQLGGDSRVVAYSTWADATNGTTNNPAPGGYIHSILPNGMLAGGESTGNGNTTTAGMNLMFQNAKAWHWYVANWYFNSQSQTLQQIVAAYNNS